MSRAKTPAKRKPRPKPKGRAKPPNADSVNRRISDPRGTKQWPLWVMAARDVMLGATRDAAALGVGRSRQTLHNWMNHEAWADAEKEAYDLAIRGTLHKAMKTVDKSVERNPTLAWEFMQRALKQLAPVSKHEVGGVGGGPIQVTVTRRIVRPDAEG